jgi:hypothetical protein
MVRATRTWSSHGPVTGTAGAGAADVPVIVDEVAGDEVVGVALLAGVTAVVAGAAGAEEGAAVVVWSVGVGWSTVVADVGSPPVCPRVMTSTAPAVVRRAAATAPLTSSHLRGRRRTDGADSAASSCMGVGGGGADSSGADSSGSGVERWKPHAVQ